MKKPAIKRLLTAAALIVLLSAIAGCGALEAVSQLIYTYSAAESLEADDGTWDITLNHIRVTDEVEGVKAEDDNLFLAVNLTVKNRNRKAGAFIGGADGAVSAFLVYDDFYEFNVSDVRAEQDLNGVSVIPLASKTGNIVFVVPEEVLEEAADIEINKPFNLVVELAQDSEGNSVSFELAHNEFKYEVWGKENQIAESLYGDVSIVVPSQWSCLPASNGVDFDAAEDMTITLKIERATNSIDEMFAAFDENEAITAEGFVFNNGVNGYRIEDGDLLETLYIYEADGYFVSLWIDHYYNEEWYEEHKDSIYDTAKTIEHNITPIPSPMTRIPANDADISVVIPEQWGYYLENENVYIQSDSFYVLMELSVTAREELEGMTLESIVRHDYGEAKAFSFYNGAEGYVIVDEAELDTMFVYDADGDIIMMYVDYQYDEFWYDKHIELIYSMARTLNHGEIVLFDKEASCVKNVNGTDVKLSVLIPKTWEYLEEDGALGIFPNGTELVIDAAVGSTDINGYDALETYVEGFGLFFEEFLFNNGNTGYALYDDINSEVMFIFEEDGYLAALGITLFGESTWYRAHIDMLHDIAKTLDIGMTFELGKKASCVSAPGGADAELSVMIPDSWEYEAADEVLYIYPNGADILIDAGLFLSEESLYDAVEQVYSDYERFTFNNGILGYLAYDDEKDENIFVYQDGKYFAVLIIPMPAPEDADWFDANTDLLLEMAKTMNHRVIEQAEPLKDTVKRVPSGKGFSVRIPAEWDYEVMDAEDGMIESGSMHILPGNEDIELTAGFMVFDEVEDCSDFLFDNGEEGYAFNDKKEGKAGFLYHNDGYSVTLIADYSADKQWYSDNEALIHEIAATLTHYDVATYENNRGGIIFDYPADWHVYDETGVAEEDGSSGIFALFSASGTDGYPHLTIGIGERDDQLLKYTKEQMWFLPEFEYDEHKVIEYGRTILDGVPAIRVVSEVIIKGVSHMVYYYRYNNGEHSYALTFGYSNERRDIDMSVYERILGSYKIIPK